MLSAQSRPVSHPRMPSARDRFIAFRRSVPRAPHLARRIVRARGIDFAVFSSPAVEGPPPLLCVNGGMLFDHTLLWPALSPLAATRQLLLYDQRGRGESGAPPGVRAARIEHDAGDVRAIREALGIGRWDVLGHSWGGGIGMLAAELDREATRRLVLVDAIGPTSAWMSDLVDRAAERLGPTGRAALQRFDAATLATDDPGVHSAYSRVMYPAWFADRELAELFSPPRSESQTGAAVLARLRRDGYDWRALLGGVHVPTLVIHGDHDLLPVSVAQDLATALPNARLELMPGAGHMPFWEAPERFFEAVERFLGDPAT